MLTKLKELSTQAKVAIGAGLAALLAIGIGLGIAQPWNQADEPPQEPEDQQQEPVTPSTPVETGLSVKANGEEVPCTLYEGDGWSVYVPEGWEAAGTGGNGALFTSPDGAEMQVDFLPVDGGTGAFYSLADVDGTSRQLQFCDGSNGGSPVLTGRGPKTQWDRYGKLFLALAKTLRVGTDQPYDGNYVIPWEPDWQVAEGSTVLFIGKDGIILDDKVQAAVEEYMRTWSEADRALYTGQYRINGIDWAASYTGLTDGYIDVFRARVQYRLAEGGEEAVLAQDGGVTVADGWATLPESVHLVLTHDGGDIEKTQTVVAPAVSDWVSFVGLIK